MQIHLDEEFAKSVGLPGIIIHGLCTMAFTSVAAIEHACPDDPTRLRRLAVRFASIALPEQTITTRIWDAGERDGRTGYAYETTSDAGAVVIKDGLGGDRVTVARRSSARPRSQSERRAETRGRLLDATVESLIEAATRGPRSAG